MFIVPKYLVKEDGSIDSKRNAVCVGIENKMGIKGSPTCVMGFEESIGYLVGKPHDGLRQMFIVMNAARLGIGMQGLAHAQLSYIQARMCVCVCYCLRVLGLTFLGLAPLQ